MRWVEAARRLTCGAAALFLGVWAAPSEAKPAQRDSAPLRQCRGVDMLEELRTSDPAAYEKMIADAAKVENAKALLWKIEKPGVAPSHLIGTMHVTDPRVTTLTPATQAVLRTASTVLLEVADMSPAATAAAVGKATSLLLFTDGRRLDALLSADDYATAKATVQRAGLPGELAAAIRPWLVSTLLAVSDCERKNAEAGHAVLDAVIEREARKRKIPVIGLETIDMQIAAMAAVPDDEQVKMLRASLRFAHRADDMLETMTLMYLKRDMAAAMPFSLMLGAKAGIEPSAYEGFQRELLHKRNVKMRDGAVPLINKGGAVLAVGALHLSGPTGLVTLLRQSGYTVTPVE